MNGEMHNRTFFLNPPDILLRQRGPFCNLCYDLLIVVGDLQLFCDSAAKLAAAAAKFTADGDDPIPIVLLSGKSLLSGAIMTVHKCEPKYYGAMGECLHS